MKELKDMIGSRKRIITLALLAIALGVVYQAATHRWFFAGRHGDDQKVLYWYDAMNPQNHYDKPGKAPDGMDLVPAYADHPDSSAAGMSSQGQAESGRKALYWYDAMNPQNHYQKPGKAPDGMDLVPMYEPQQSQSSSAGQSAADQRKILYWYDPMHPAYRSDKPGTAPDCGMTLVPKYADDQDMAKMPVGTIVIPEDKQKLAGVRTTVVERKSLVREIRTTAQIVPDETRISHVHVKVAGYIDQVFVDYVGQLVKKGQPLFTLYSPDLVSTQEEYLIAKRGDATLGTAPFKEVSLGAQSLLDSARKRLKLWDISDEQIKELDQTGKVSRDLTFYSPVTGFVMDRKAFPQTSVTPDTELYTVADLSTVWANADIFEYEVPFVRVGQHVSFTLSYYPGKTYTGEISYIYPTVDPQARTVRVRVQIPNPEFALKPQMFADAQLQVNYGTKVLVPQEAVLDAGTTQQVFVVHSGGVFEPRKVTLGPIIDGNVAVLSGLKPGEIVVSSGNFLVDSESRLKTSIGSVQ
jgi:RND family efflux transporter MFP subunit